MPLHAVEGLEGLESAEAVERETCIYARDIKRFEILSEEFVLVFGKHDRYWLNRLDSRCVGLRKNMIITTNRYGSQLCANDRFAARAVAGPNDGPMRQCQLGTFEAIALEQIPTLRQSLREG